MSQNSRVLSLDLYNPQKEFSCLNLQDLLLARALNHYELMRKPNVVATAIGYYLIRKKEHWPSPENKNPHPADRGARTLGNSEVRSYSWPCVLVFVKEWIPENALGHDESVPPALYLDGRRKVPVCVVQAPLVETTEEPIRNVIWPSDTIGGGFPIIAKVQGREHIASIGCLVTDGHTTYALTNRHVAGKVGEPIFGRAGGQLIEVGVSSEKQLASAPFSTIYKGLQAQNVLLNLDIGLVKIHDLNGWSSQVYGLPPMGPIVDLGAEDPLLRLIDCPVRAYGCGSGQMSGAIKALFYRYDKKRDSEYVCDFLIGPFDEEEEKKFSTHPGDSGTVWMVEVSKDDLRPIAIQWGGHVFSDSSSCTMTPYALATSLATACQLLEVDVIRDWNLMTTEYWGEMGHYSIGAKAASLEFTNLNLGKLINANFDRIGFDDQTLSDKERYSRNAAHYKFVPLADVADDVWRLSRPQDANNHFADMDDPASSGKYKGQSLLGLCVDDTGQIETKNVDPQVWLDYFAGVPGSKPGALPFRIWQMYEEMVADLRGGDVLGFLTGAGCMAHYVGDASQPLHISALHHNDPGGPSWQHNVHSVYETQMLNEHAPDIVNGLNERLKGKKVGPISGFEGTSGGHRAACRVVQLMVETLSDGGVPRTTEDATNLARKICDTYNAAGKPSQRLDALWADFELMTLDRMAAACICLGEIWTSAWEDAKGDTIAKLGDLEAAQTSALAEIYNDPKRFPSMELKAMVDLLNTPA
jgi:hypothetical protein